MARDGGVSGPRARDLGTERDVRPVGQAAPKRMARVAHVIEGRGCVSAPFVRRLGTDPPSEGNRTTFGAGVRGR